VRTGGSRWLILGSIAAATALLSGCRMDDAAAAPATTTVSSPASSSSSAPASTSSAGSSSTKATKSPARQPGQGSSAGGNGTGSAPCNPRGDENCPQDSGSIDCGKVDGPDGHQVSVISTLTPSGQVGCTEAIDVISGYYRDAPTKSEGSAHALTVDGWNCLLDEGAQGSGQIGCANHDGLNVHTRP
jgi:hypothetical protein